MDITPDHAELFGMHAGDGTLYRTQRGVVWELRGDLKERDFYQEVVVPLLAKLDIQVALQKRSGGPNGCLGVRSCDRTFHTQLTDAGFPIGKKTHNVRMPPTVRTGNQEIKAAFLRGLFATDGTCYLARINGGKKATYPMIEFCSASVALRDEVVALLAEFGLDAKTWDWTPRSRGGTTHHLRLAGSRKTKLFASKIRLSNPKHRRVIEQMRNL